jgi:hypothetical protein
MGAVAKSYMRKGFLICEEIRKYLVIHEEAVRHIWFVTAPFWISLYLRKILFSFYQCSKGRKIFSCTAPTGQAQAWNPLKCKLWVPICLSFKNIWQGMCRIPLFDPHLYLTDYFEKINFDLRNFLPFLSLAELAAIGKNIFLALSSSNNVSLSSVIFCNSFN